VKINFKLFNIKTNIAKSKNELDYTILTIIKIQNSQYRFDFLIRKIINETRHSEK